MVGAGEWWRWGMVGVRGWLGGGNGWDGGMMEVGE